MENSIVERIIDTYDKWKVRNYPALAIKVRPEHFKKIQEEGNCKADTITIERLPVEIDVSLPKNHIAFKEASLKNWEIVKLL